MGKERRNGKKGRLVFNHSTHLPGLIPVLERLAERSGVKTITPGRIARVRGRPTPLTIRVTVPITGGHKMQARCQGSVQEVFVVTDLAAEALQSIVDEVQTV